MFRLATFGGLSVTDGGAPDVVVPRRRLALLALLAVAGDRGLTRDKLIAYLWPESSSDDARHSLEQMLYSLRRQLGPTVLTGIDPLRLNPEVIASDVAVFAAAVARRANDEAVAMYAGPFLDGFYLKDADEFGRWVEEERTRLSAEYGRALERVAERASHQGDWPATVEAWRRLVALDRLSARNVLGLMRALASAGDRSGALQVAASHESLVRHELGMPVEASIASFVESLRNGNGKVSGIVANEERASSAVTSLTEHAASTASDASPRASSVRTRSLLRTRRVRLVATIAGIAGVLAIISLWYRTSLRPTPPVRLRVAVAVFENRTGDSTFNLVGIMVADYTRDALQRTGLLDVMAPAFDLWQLGNAQPANRASDATLLRLTRADIVVRGAYYKDGDSLRFTGQGIDTKTGQLFFVFDGIKTGLTARFDAVERVRQQVTSGIATHVDPALTAWAGKEGRPPIRFDAYQEFADGMTNFVSAITEQGRGNVQGEVRLFNAARDHLERAVHLDSTYMIAALWLFWSRYNVGDHAGADTVLTALEPRVASMSLYERALYEYNEALMHDTPERRYQMDIQLVEFARASEFRFCLIRDALESNHPVEALEALATLDDSYSWMRFMRPPSGFRVRALVEQGKFKPALDAARAIRDRAPDDLTPAYPEIDALAALGRFDEIEPVVDRFQRPGAAVAPNLANLMLYAGLRLQSAGRFDRAKRQFEQAFAAYDSRVSIYGASDADLLGRARSLYYLGQWDKAREAFERIARAPLGRRRDDRKAFLFLGSLAQRRRDSSEVSRLRRLLENSHANPAMLSYFDARIAAIRGDTAAALSLWSKAVSIGAQAEELVMEGDAAASMEPDFAALRGSPEFRKALGRW